MGAFGDMEVVSCERGPGGAFEDTKCVVADGVSFVGGRSLTRTRGDAKRTGPSRGRGFCARSLVQPCRLHQRPSTPETPTRTQ